MAGIQLSGLASGLDTQSIISQLMAVERLPRTTLTNQQSSLQAHENATKSIETSLKALGDAATALSSAATWNPVQTVDSSDTTKVSARQLSGSGPGSYQLAVTQLASADQHTYAFTSPSAATTLSIGSTSIAIAAGATVDDVVSSVNSSTTAGVFAVNVNGSLVLAAKATGTANAFTAGSSALVEDPTKARAAQDAQYTVDNGAVQTSSSNVVTSAVPGVELTLKGTTAGTTITVGNPGVNTAAVTSAVKSFVDSYNSAMDALRSATTEQPVSGDPTKGTLYGDSSMTDTMDSLRNAVGSTFSVGNTSAMSMLSEIGVSTGATTGDAAYNPDAVAGKLTLDTTALANALSDPQSVQRLLGAAAGSTTGLAQTIQGTLDPYTQVGGVLDSSVTSDDSGLRDVASQLADFDQRMTDRQAFLQQQFTTLETSLSSLNSQGASLSSWLAGVPAGG